MHANIISEAEVSTAFRFFYGAFCTVTISTKSNKLLRKGGERFVFVRKGQKKEHGSIEPPVMRLLTAWCLTADLLSFAIYPFYELDNTAKLQFPIFFLVFSLQILFLALFEHFLRNRYPLPERLILPISLGVYTFLTIGQKKDFFFILLLSCLWAILLYYYNVRGWLRFKKRFTKKKGVLLIATAALIFFVVVGGSGLLRYLTFRCPNYDFGIFSHMFYNMKNSFQPLTTCERDGTLSHFAVHLSPILYVLLPVYFVFSSPITL